MKNMVKLFGIVALVAAIGFSMAACSDPDDGSNNGGGGGSQGTITITGIPAEYNGKYAGFEAADSGINVRGFTSKGESHTYTYPQISNGSVSLKAWEIRGGNSDAFEYSGSHTFAEYSLMRIYGEQTETWGAPATELAVRQFGTAVKSTNGNITLAWGDGS